MFTRSIGLVILAMSAAAGAARAPIFVQYGPDCAGLDSDQRAVNADWRALKGEYPFTTSFLMSCVKGAKDQGAVTSCMGVACVMASKGSQNQNEGCIDFGTKLSRIGMERDSLMKRKRLYQTCPAMVPDETDD